jgi:diguanylate cyclase (GGDEF)-like protein
LSERQQGGGSDGGRRDAAPGQTALLAIEAAGLAAYRWTIASDELIWSPHASEILGVDAAQVNTGRIFASFLDPDNLTSRYETVMRGGEADGGNGVAFEIEYRFRPAGRGSRASLWLEDQGRWFAGHDGRPAEVLGVVRRIDQRQKRDEHLSFLGNCDPLTGMMNRGRMMEALGGAMMAAGREGSSCAFLVAAINNLPLVNEAYGFEVADEVIVTMGRRLQRVVRSGDAVARYSGSKFGIVLNHCSPEELPIAAERFLSVARDSVIETGHGPVWALLSIGAVVLPRHASDPGTAIARAEEALSEARKHPADDVVIYKPSEQLQSQRSGNAHNAHEIVRCLKEGRLQLAFQPVVDAATGRPEFHEALLRMKAADGSTVAAGHLIPVAEKLGLVRLIDREVVQMALGVLARHHEAKLSLNISGTTATDPRWYPQIIALLSGHKALAPRLTVEITETVALSDMRATTRFVEQLKALGIKVAIDDFGAGFTSFRHLRAIPVDILKLDGSFCEGLSRNPENQYYVRSLLALAQNFGIRTVAEWVETAEDAALLKAWGVDMMQGRLFGMAELAPPWPESGADNTPLPPPAQETVAAFEQDLEGELAKLRHAVTLLDRAFTNRTGEIVQPEPSLADLVSDTARSRAG